MEDLSSSSELQHVQMHWAGLRDRSPIYGYFLKDIQIVSATKGTIISQLRVLPVHVNSKGTLHGTISACLTDWAGGMAIASTGLDNTGVSTDIHTTYISTAKEGDLLEIEATASKVGSTLAFTTVKIQKVAADGSRRPVANGSHTKYLPFQEARSSAQKT